MGNLDYLFVLISFTFIISSGIHIFSRGFLLTRTATTEKRVCSKFVISSDENLCLSDDKKSCTDEVVRDYVSKNINAENLCFERKSKVVVVLIDALKYDFGVFDENLTNPLPYQNKLPIIHELLKRRPDHARLLKFIADPPTTTLQRLKAMTTGSLPTFIDMGSNFATPEINEDNVIDQIYSNNLTVVFLGDSTWIELFPKRFKRQFAFPSFNIYDLDSVDNEIVKLFPKELKKDDWDLLVAHFLGVDHCGHKFGPLHPEMSRKLLEMNEVIKKLTETIDDDTTLIVMGDHGMTASGDHGGSSDDETEALLFAYSKKLPFVPSRYDEDIKLMQQIDLPATLAAILGVPVPYSNLGTLQLQLLPDVSSNNLMRHQVLASHLWHNAKQIQSYFTKYSEEHQETFAFDDLDVFDTKFEVFEHRVNSLPSDDAFQSFAKDLRNHLDSVLELCRHKWVKFNPQLMAHGMTITLLGIFTSFILVFNVPLREYPNVFSNKLVKFLIPTSIVSGVLGYYFHQKIGMDDSFLSALFIASAWKILVFGFIFAKHWSVISEEMSASRKLINLMPRVTFVTTILVFFSNSFIIHEQKILSFLLAAQVVYATCLFRKEIAEFKGKVKILSFMRSTFVTVFLGSSVGILVLLRLSHNYFKCREEQGNCWSLVANAENEKGKGDKFDLIPVAVLIISVTISRIFLKSSGNLTGLSTHVLMMKFAPTVSLIATCAHMILSQYQKGKQIIPAEHLDALAWLVYGIFVLEVLVVLVNPLMIHIIPRNSNQFSISNYDYAVPQLFNYVKKVFNKDPKNKSGDIPIIYGLATVYSSVFVAVGTSLAILLSLLLSMKVMNGLLITLAMGIGILVIFSILRFESTRKAIDCLQPQFAVVVAWFVLVNYGFYATSHQPTISQIDWSAAFVGRAAHFDHSNVISALLVLVSTFNSQLLFHIIYPIIVLFPFMIYAIYPSLSINLRMLDKKVKEDKPVEFTRITLNTEEKDSVKSNQTDFDTTRGEVFLFENENLFISSVFKIGCQLMILQSVKVLASMIACTILSRHLMVWKIFAPRFIYEGIATYVSFIGIILGFALLLRVHRSVKALVDKIYVKT